jgi:hypothetical protein
MNIPIIGGPKPPDLDNRMRQGDVKIGHDGDMIVMQQCVVITSQLLPEQAMAFANALGGAAQQAMAVQVAAMRPNGLADAFGANGNGAVH